MPTFGIGSRRMGPVWSAHIALDPTAVLELSFAARCWASVDPVDEGTRTCVDDTFQIVVDKDGELAALKRACAAAPS